jgi:hypothetical protein
MPSVIDDTDILEHTTSATEYDEIQARPLPLSRRGRAHLYAPLRRLHLHWKQTRPLQRPPQPVMSMDTLARTYPDIYLRLTSWAI